MPPEVSALADLRHQPERHVAGTVDHYIKSNLDGTYPARVAIYLAGPDTLEVLKLEAHNADAVHITAHLDWRTFSMDHAESWIITPDGQRHLQAEVAFDSAANRVALSVRGRRDVVALDRYPAHIYNFDLISLNVMLRHWTEPEGALTFEVLQPVFTPDPPALLRAEGPATLRYLGREGRGGQPCRAYTLGGAGLRGLTGRAWVNLAGGYFEDVEMPLPDNPAWDSFKFQWAARTTLDAAGWQAHIAAAVRGLTG